MLQRLLNEHRELERLAEALADILKQDEPDQAELIERRWALAKAMMQHLAYEDRNFYLPMEQDKRPEIAEIARRFKDDLNNGQAAFQEHTARWSAAAMAADRRGYRKASLEQIRVLLDRIRREEAELFPLIANDAAFDGSSPPMQSQRNWARDAWDVHAALRA